MSALSQQQPRKDHVAVCLTDAEAVVPRSNTKKVDKQSWDYIWRSGTAGGLAGCAVSCLASHVVSS